MINLRFGSIGTGDGEVTAESWASTFRKKLKQSLYRSGVFQEGEVSRFHDNRHMKAVSLSALHTAPFTGTHFC